MPLFALAGLISLGCLAQEAPPAAKASTPERDAELLRSDDIRVREAAERRLGSLPAARVPFLRARLAAEGDCEVRERLTEALRRVCAVEADRLLSEGRVDACLSWLSGFGEGQEREAFVRETKQEVARRIRAELPESPCTDDFPQDYSILATDIEREFGPWGIAVLFDALEAGDSDLPAVSILQEMGDGLVPCLARALRERGPNLRREISAVLYAMTFDHDRIVEDGFGLSEGLTALAEGPGVDPGTRMRCRYVLERLRPPASDDEPVGEAH
jgi:hypothetical protein